MTTAPSGRSLAAELRAEVTGPESLLAHPLLERPEDRAGGLVVDVVRVTAVREEEVERLALLAHEGRHPVQLLLEVGVRREVPHRVALLACSLVFRQIRTVF